MVVARATSPNGTEIFVLGLTEENINLLKKGKPIFADAKTNPGFPPNIAITILYGKIERNIIEQIQSFISDETKIIAVPKEKSNVQ